MLIEGLMKTACIIIACDPKDQSQIYGYLCLHTIEGAPVVHFAYVKKAYRALGIAKLMLNNSTVDKLFFITHHTAPISRISTEKYVLVYNPYLAYPLSGRTRPGKRILVCKGGYMSKLDLFGDVDVAMYEKVCKHLKSMKMITT